MTARLTYEFVKEQFKKEGYTLKSTTYKSCGIKLDVVCPEGHAFNVRYDNFKYGTRCPICYQKNKSEIQRKYDHKYVKKYIKDTGHTLLSDSYKNTKQILKIKCPKGHEYEKDFYRFMKGERCSVCAQRKKYTYDEVKKFIEDRGYTLLSKEYSNARTPLDLVCPKGHQYSIRFSNFKRGSRCLKCDSIRKKETAWPYEKVKRIIENKEFILLSSEYKNARSGIKVQCPYGHDFDTTFDRISNGHGCPQCKNIISKPEIEIREYIESLGVKIETNIRSLIKNPDTGRAWELDIVVPDKKLAVEYCGLYNHSDEFKPRKYHLEKLNECNKIGYRLITIFGDEWDFKKKIVKNSLRHILGLSIDKVYARQCVIKEIDDNGAEIFLDRYHIQGYVNSSIKIGAFYKNELVAVISLRKSNDNLHLSRLCTSKNVIGILGRFLSYLKSNYSFSKIITFADRRWSEGKVYEILGFDKEGYIKPDYSYFKSKVRYHKFNFRHTGMKNKLDNYDPALSESENMINNGWHRIWDCGKIRFSIKNGSH